MTASISVLCSLCILTNAALEWSQSCPAGAKLQERISGQSFNFDIAKFAKAAEASKAQAGPGPDSATKASTLKKAQASVKRDWNAQVLCNPDESCE